MIDLESAKQELIFHVKEMELENPRAPRKLEHIMRVTKISRELASSLGLTEEQIQLAELIGLLHDIGRFEQYRVLDKNTSSIVLDTEAKFNHGEAGVKILKKDNYIRKYIAQDTYDDLILTAVYEHNRYAITEGLSKEKELFCKIIKDADKIDLMYEAIAIYWQEKKDIEEIETGSLSEKMLADFYQHKLADNRNRISRTDQILRFTSFVFDIHFPYSFKILAENDYVSRMIDRFDYQIKETKEEMKRVKAIANEEIKQRKDLK